MLSEIIIAGDATVSYVLILVLVDHTLGAFLAVTSTPPIVVLILVLVDHTLGVLRVADVRQFTMGLNPCFSGPYSRSLVVFSYSSDFLVS